MKLKLYIASLLILLTLPAMAKDTTYTVNGDTLFLYEKETVLYVSEDFDIQPFKPDPSKAIWYAAVVPGLGQIYNRKYWKLPILYGGAMGLSYAITWNGGLYRDYQKAYRDMLDDNPATESYLNVLPVGVEIDSSNKSYYTSLLKNKQDNYLRNRDLSIIGTVGLYLLSIVDAYVDAHLYDFDISPDLSLKVSPRTMPNPYTDTLTGVSVGVSCSMRF